MIVVSNTSPLNYLLQIEAEDILNQLFDSILIPKAVQQELSHTSSPDIIRSWIAKPPSWLQIKSVDPDDDLVLATLHRGEREAILLAEKLQADLLILDEKAARIIAMQHGLGVVGTLGILNEAGARNLINIPTAVNRLRQTTFRASPTLYKWLLDQHEKRASFE